MFSLLNNIKHPKRIHVERNVIMEGGREAQEGGDICIPMIDLHCCKAEHNIVKQLSSNLVFFKKIHNHIFQISI